LESIDFDELNKIGEDWEHKVVAPSAEADNANEATEDVQDQDAPQDANIFQDANDATTGEA